jgi:hypothetical protein
MWDFLETIENSGFATYVRETPTVLGYSTVLALHTFGMAFLVGFSGVIALRVLGLFRDVPLAPMRRLFPLIVAGFWVNAASGLILTSLAARSLLTNWDFYIKLVAIACAIVSLRALLRSAFDVEGRRELDPLPPATRGWAVAMITFWGIAVLAGRLTAYTNGVRIQSTIAVAIAILVLLAARQLVLRIARYVRTPTIESEPAAAVRTVRATTSKI